MANFYGFARSNYFKVKDVAAFTTEVAERYDLTLITNDDVPGAVGLLADRTDQGTWPSSWYDEDKDEDHDIDIADEVAKHLVDGGVAIFEEVGAEKLRYLVGWAIAINSKGERRYVSLNTIVDLARELTDRPQDVTDPSY